MDEALLGPKKVELVIMMVTLTMILMPIMIMMTISLFTLFVLCNSLLLS